MTPFIGGKNAPSGAGLVILSALAMHCGAVRLGLCPRSDRSIGGENPAAIQLGGMLRRSA